MEQQHKCAYCPEPLSTNEMYIYGGKKYHPACAERVKARRSYPATYRMLDEARSLIELLYTKEGVVIKNIDTLEKIHENLKSVVNVPQP